MKKSITYTEKFFLGNTLIDLGFRDYIAARFLLNNYFIIQGLTLASTSVEKYLKALIVLNLRDRIKYDYHFDRFKELKNILSKVNEDITSVFDPYFIEILENAFKIRYYDKIEKPILMGFFINQLIGELDYTIDFLDNYIAKQQTNGQSFSAYNRAIKKNDLHLYKNNYILNKENKKDFMEKPDIGFSICIRNGSAAQEEKIVKGGRYKNKYDGHISKFTEFETNLIIQTKTAGNK